VEASGDVPAERATEGASLADALRRAAAPESERVVNPRDQGHGESLRPFRQALGAQARSLGAGRASRPLCPESPAQSRAPFVQTLERVFSCERNVPRWGVGVWGACRPALGEFG
jgi:hypothetical protein